MIQQSHSWTYIQTKTIIQKDTCIPMFIASLFHKSQDMEATRMSLNRWTDREDVAHTYDGMLRSHKKEQNNAICRNMNATTNYQTK